MSGVRHRCGLASLGARCVSRYRAKKHLCSTIDKQVTNEKRKHKRQKSREILRVLHIPPQGYSSLYSRFGEFSNTEYACSLFLIYGNPFQCTSFAKRRSLRRSPLCKSLDSLAPCLTTHPRDPSYPTRRAWEPRTLPIPVTEGKLGKVNPRGRSELGIGTQCQGGSLLDVAVVLSGDFTAAASFSSS